MAGVVDDNELRLGPGAAEGICVLERCLEVEPAVNQPARDVP